MSEYCRDSLDTNTQHTRITQTTPELAASSNGAPGHRVQRQPGMLGQGLANSIGMATIMAEREPPRI